MWHYLEHINIVLNGVIRVLSNLPKAQVASMKLASNPQLRRRTMKAVHIDGGHSKEIGKVVTSHSNIPYVTNSSGEMIPGVLQYVMEGVLPLIKVGILTSCNIVFTLKLYHAGLLCSAF